MNIQRDNLINDINKNVNNEAKIILNKELSEKKFKSKLLKPKVCNYSKIEHLSNKKSNRSIETLSSIIFVLVFIILILSLLIFFKHIR
jgi:hypothetical protein